MTHTQNSVASTSEVPILKIFYQEPLSNDNKGRPDPQENSCKLCDERGYSLLNVKESQWKPRQQHDQKFSSGGKATAEQMLGSEERNKFKRIGL